MSEIKFKFGTTVEGATINETDLVMVNEGMYDGATAVETKLGSVYKGTKIVGTTKADELRLTKELQINGGPLAEQALKVFPDGIPAGTSMTEIFTALFLQELYPNAAQKPTIDISGEKSLGVLEVGSSAQIPSVSMTKDAGKFEASYSEPVQPATDVTWSNESMTATVTGFTGATIAKGTTSLSAATGTVVEGTNKVAYSASADYSAPANNPVTNLGNETTNAEYTFNADKATKDANTTATGVYPIYANGIELTATKTNDDAAFGTNEINKMATLVNYVSGEVKKYIGFGGQATNTWYVYLPKSVTLVSAKGYNPNTGKFEIAYTFTNEGAQSIDTTYVKGAEYVKYSCSGTGAKNNVEFKIKK